MQRRLRLGGRTPGQTGATSGSSPSLGPGEAHPPGPWSLAPSPLLKAHRLCQLSIDA